jgi:hypothetical protein
MARGFERRLPGALTVFFGYLPESEIESEIFRGVETPVALEKLRMIV